MNRLPRWILKASWRCKAIDNLVHNRTVIIIAHRLSTIAGAGNILVIEEGQVVEQGTHAQLLSHHGRYQALWQAQMAARVWRDDGRVPRLESDCMVMFSRCETADVDDRAGDFCYCRRLCDAESGIGAVYAVLTRAGALLADRWRLPVRQPCSCCPGR